MALNLSLTGVAGSPGPLGFLFGVRELYGVSLVEWLFMWLVVFACLSISGLITDEGSGAPSIVPPFRFKFYTDGTRLGIPSNEFDIIALFLLCLLRSEEMG